MTVLDLASAPGDREIASSLTESIALEAANIGTFEVTSQQAVATLIGVERQKQLLGCSEEATNCMMELAQALGSRFVISGSLVKLGNAWQLNLQMLDTRKSATVGRATRLANDLETVRAQLPWALAEVTGTPAPRSPSRVLPYGLMIGGGVAVLTGGVLFLQSFTREETVLAELNAKGASLRGVDAYATEAAQISQLRVIASITAGVGAALVVTGLLLNPRSDAVVRVTIAPTFGGATLVGVFP